jgi:predicted thioesterase
MIEHQIEPGVEGRIERLVEGALLTRHVGGEGIFATPAMIELMEWTAHESVVPLLPAGSTTVGYEICVRHLAPVEPGETVVVTSILKEVRGNRLHFDVTCTKNGTHVGSGIHKRAVVPARTA